MLRIIWRRVALSIPLLLVVSSSTFLLVDLIPGDVAQALLGPQATAQQYHSLRHSLGLDASLPSRYWQWLAHAVHGDLGVSLFQQEPVTSLLNARLAPTASLVIGSTVVATFVGVLFGLGGALRGGIMGRMIDLIASIGLAVPNFFLGLMLVILFAVDVHIFPATGYVNLTDSVGQWLRSIVLPVITLAIPGVAVIAKQTRDAMCDVLEGPFIQTLRASGLPRRSIIFKHALRSAAIPVVTVVGIVFISALGGTVVVEAVFAIPGLGGLAVQAASEHDFPLIQGVVVYFTVIVIVVNLFVDLLYGWLDPRVRTS